jgi:plasmid stabilization system protein ParE
LGGREERRVTSAAAAAGAAAAVAVAVAGRFPGIFRPGAELLDGMAALLEHGRAR